jgi:hypothetical protein
MVDEPDDPAEEVEYCREPTPQDLADLCRELNSRGARYLVVGGFAMNAAGYNRRTMDLDLLIDTSLENEALVTAALESLPDKAIREMKPGEVAEFGVVRVMDDFAVDLMKSACAIDYAEASRDVVILEIDGVPVPFASPRMLWRMKRSTHREKDAADLYFLGEWFRARGESPPE